MSQETSLDATRDRQHVNPLKRATDHVTTGDRSRAKKVVAGIDDSLLCSLSHCVEQLTQAVSHSSVEYAAPE
jgi:hypothetical protein